MEAWLEPVYDATGMRAADTWAIDEQQVPSLELMETAGAAVAEAARFAAKEAAVKALGGGGLAPREIEVTGGGREAPRLRLHGRAAAVAAERGVDLQVSLTHSQEVAAAAVLAVRAATSEQ